MEKTKINPYAALIVSVVSVSVSTILVKYYLVPPRIIAFYWLFFSIIFIIPIFLTKKYISELRHITSEDWLFSSIIGILLAFHFTLWFDSLNYTSVASSTVLVILRPLFAFLGTYIFLRKRSK